MIIGKFKNERLIVSPQERLYLYGNSTQISSQTGFQGYLRGDFDHGGDKFFSRFVPFGTRDRFAEGFTDALQEVMDTLREDILASFSSMKKFCAGDGKESAFSGNWTTEYAFRIDHNGFAFMFRLIPEMGDYHVYVHCYRADWLDQHMEQAKRGIRFINSDYQEKFRLEDGGKIRIVASGDPSYSDSESTREYVCRYIDDYHVEMGIDLFHICQFAELMEWQGRTVEPVSGKMDTRKGRADA